MSCGALFPLQPVADRPFTFETELDDLPKEKLKGEAYKLYYSISELVFVKYTELIYDEIIKFVSDRELESVPFCVYLCVLDLGTTSTTSCVNEKHA